MRSMLRVGAIALLSIATAACAAGGTPKPNSGATASAKWPTTTAAIAAYQGADRQQMLEAGARKEGTVSWYTSLAGDVLDAMSKGFEQKYPYLKVEPYRPAGSRALVTKISEEVQAKKYNADVVNSGLADLLPLRDDVKAFIPYYTPASKNYPAETKDTAQGGLDYWVPVASDYIVFAYNTNLLPPSAVPKTYQDLLSPALKGKMALGAASGPYWLGDILTNEGQPFAEQLAKQDLQVQQISAKALLDLIVSGEVAASPTIYKDHVLQAQEKGAPVKWVALQPVTDNAGSMAVVANAPHPHAALLFADFVVGPEGQQILQKLHYESEAEDPGFKRWIPGHGMTTADFEQKFNAWQDFQNKQFVGR